MGTAAVLLRRLRQPESLWCVAQAVGLFYTSIKLYFVLVYY